MNLDYPALIRRSLEDNQPLVLYEGMAWWIYYGLDANDEPVYVKIEKEE